MMIIKLALRRIQLLIHQPKQLLLLILLPMLATAMMNLLWESSTKDLRIPIVIIDEDQSESSRWVSKELRKEELLQVLNIEKKEALRGLKRHDVEAVFILPQGFEKGLLNGKRESLIHVFQTPLSLTTGIVNELIASRVTRLSSNILAADVVVQQYTKHDLFTQQPHVSKRELWQKAWDYTDNQWEPEPLMSISYHTYTSGEQSTTNEDNKPEDIHPFATAFSFTSPFILLLCLLANGWLIEERQGLLIRRIRTLGLKTRSYLMSQSLAYIFIIIVTSILPFIFSVKTNIGLGSTRELWMILSFFTLFIIASWGIGLFLASLCHSLRQLYVSSLFISLFVSLSNPFSLLGEMTKGLTFFSVLSPASWALNGLRDALAYSVEKSLLEMSLLVLVGILGLMLAIRKVEQTND